MHTHIRSARTPISPHFRSTHKNTPPPSGVSRVLECCQECGVGSLVFMSSSKVVSPGRKQQQQGQGRGGKYDDGISVGGGVGVGLCDESLPYVARRENEAAHSIAMAEAEVLKARWVLTCQQRKFISANTGRPGGRVGRRCNLPTAFLREVESRVK